MPGPPPPSKSYNLKIVDSSDEEDDDNEYRHYSSNNRASEENNKEEDEEGMLVDEHHPSASVNATESSPPKKKTKNKRNNRNKKKKKKKKQASSTGGNSGAEEEEEGGDNTDNKHGKGAASSPAKRRSTKNKAVQFDSVRIHSFERCLGQDTVPYDGGWPLGLGPAIAIGSDACEDDEHEGISNSSTIAKEEVVDLEDYELAKQERLRVRAQEKGLTYYAEEKSSDNAPRLLETRQWDYKHTKNPLFHLLTEEQRMSILLQASTPLLEDESDPDIDNSSHRSPPTKRNSKASSSAPTKRDSKGSSSPTKRDSKINSDNSNNNHPSSGHHSHHALHHTGHHINTRSNTANRRERSGSISEHYNDTYTQVKVHHVRNELEELRFQRSGEGHTGCTCRKLDVYLLPPGGGGKKAAHRRMKVLRVKEELIKRHILPTETKTREELELLLHDTVEQEACCINADCPCVRNGIECQADVCACWYDSHQTKEQGKAAQHDSFAHSSSNTDNVEEIQARCGNPNGMYAVDLVQIHEMRQQIIQAYTKSGQYVVCPPISPHTPRAV